MPRPNAPRPDDPCDLDVIGALPDDVVELSVTVSFGNSDERVHLRVDAVCWSVGHSHSLILGTARCGVRVWRRVLLPGIHALCQARSLGITVREVESGPAVQSPSARSARPAQPTPTAKE